MWFTLIFPWFWEHKERYLDLTRGSMYHLNQDLTSSAPALGPHLGALVNLPKKCGVFSLIMLSGALLSGLAKIWVRELPGNTDHTWARDHFGFSFHSSETKTKAGKSVNAQRVSLGHCQGKQLPHVLRWLLFPRCWGQRLEVLVTHHSWTLPLSVFGQTFCWRPRVKFLHLGNKHKLPIMCCSWEIQRLSLLHPPTSSYSQYHLKPFSLH